ncbi:hypothetical protein [Bradyrhizobium ganzhouense]|uniref:hypothetical protein n=1 Tax=Bradyrhizobium ganzhouense TaxID=1179767 RepID=UPI003CFAF86F
MWKPFLPLVDFIDRYQGLIIGFAVLGFFLLLNQVIYRLFWTSYPSREDYLAAHPGCASADGVLCATCGQKAVSMAVRGSGRMFRCTWCDAELFRVDRG